MNRSTVPTNPSSFKKISFEEAANRFWNYVDKRDKSSCWVWKGLKNKRQGYPECFILKLTTRYKTIKAHRISWRLSGGKIPYRHVIDHICRNRACVNPNHLRAVTIGTNVLENSEGFAAKNKAKTHCLRGHPLSGDNLKVSRHGYRNCYTCALTRERDRRQRLREVSK